MSFYLDSSAIVTSLVREPATANVVTWMEAHAADDLVISDWSITEVSSALALKLRAEAIDLALRASALAAFHQMLGQGLEVLPVGGLHFQVAARFADRHELGLRAGDALHLAAAAEYGARLVTLDRRMAAAAPHLGIEVEPLA